MKNELGFMNAEIIPSGYNRFRIVEPKERIHSDSYDNIVTYLNQGGFAESTHCGVKSIVSFQSVSFELFCQECGILLMSRYGTT